MDGLTVLDTAVGLMSLVLGGFAIWFSFQFYSKGKEAETRTAVALEGVRAQSEALQKLTGRWMDRLTRYAMEPKPADEGFVALANAMANLPTAILTHLRIFPDSLTGRIPELAVAELVSAYIGLYSYTAFANVGWQMSLPASGEVDETGPVQMQVVQNVNTTARDFTHMAGIIEKLDPSLLQTSSYANVLDFALRQLRPYVADAT